MKVPEIPNNSLTKEIKELVNLCQQLEPDYGENQMYFAPPTTEKEIAAWEHQHGFTIPETYKDWLRFSNGSRICGVTADFYSVERLVVGINIEGVVNNDLVIIGNMIGNGTFICFSRKTNKICREDHGEITELENFKCVLNYIMDIM